MNGILRFTALHAVLGLCVFAALMVSSDQGVAGSASDAVNRLFGAPSNAAADKAGARKTIEQRKARIRQLKHDASKGLENARNRNRRDRAASEGRLSIDSE